MRCRELDLLRQRSENTLDSTESVSEALASRLKETEQGKADADKAATVAKDAHSELEVERARTSPHNFSYVKQNGHKRLFEILSRESESSRQQLECRQNTPDNAGETLESRLQLAQREMGAAEEAAESCTRHMEVERERLRARASIMALGSTLGGDEFLE